MEDLRRYVNDTFDESVNMKIIVWMGFVFIIWLDRFSVTRMMNLSPLHVSMCILPCPTSLNITGKKNCLTPFDRYMSNVTALTGQRYLNFQNELSKNKHP